MNKKINLFLLICSCLCLAMTQGGKRDTWPIPVTGKSIFLAEHITLSIKALTQEESEQYLTKDIIRWGYQPVQVTIENGSPDPYAFSPKSIDLPLVSSSKIAKKILSDSLPRSIGFKVAGFIFWPFAIPGTINSLLTHKSYKKFKKNLSSKSVKEEIIAPYSIFHRIFFISKEDNKEPFTITLQNQETLADQVFQINSSLEELKTVDPLPQVEENYYLTH
jgi:hypothetical protein